MWYVIEFRKMANSKLKSVSEVPSNWVDLKKMSCRWPDYANTPCELSNLISNEVTPNENFGTYGIRSVLCSTEVYSKAVEFAKRSTKTADLDTSDSEVEVFTGLKRGRFSNPLAQAKKSGANHKAAELPKVPKLPIKSSETKPVQKPTFRPPKYPAPIAKNLGRSNNEPLEEIENVAMVTSASLGLANSDNPWLVIEQALVNLISSIEATRVDIKEMKKYLAKHDAKIDWIRHNMAQSASEVPLLTEMEDKLPISNQEDLSTLELELESQSSLVALVRRLALIGGIDERKATNRTMAKVFADEFAQNFSYRGKGQKTAFDQLGLNKAVIRAVRRSFPKSTDEVIENAIKNWLKNAPTRLDNRKKAKRSGNVPSPDDEDLNSPSENDPGQDFDVLDIPSLD